MNTYKHDKNDAEEHGGENSQVILESGNRKRSPEPPNSWRGEEPKLIAHGDRNIKPYSVGDGDHLGMQVNSNLLATFDIDSTRKYLTVSKVLAFVSIFIGGVILSSISLVIALIGCAKIYSASKYIANDDAISMFKWSAVLTVLISVLALFLNAVALAYLMPKYLNALNSGDYASIFGNLFGNSTGSLAKPAPGAGLFG